MKMMSYLIHPTNGEVLIRHNGQLELLSENSKDYLLNKFGFLIENPEFYDDVTPRQILTYFAELRGYPQEKTPKRVEEVVEMWGLAKWIDKKIITFSKGMRQKIGIASTIIHDPQIIVLDEPHSGLDPTARIEVRNFIFKMKDLGKTIFLSSHLLHEVSEVADRVAIISKGQLIACDSLDNLETQAKKSVIQLELYPRPNGNTSLLLDRLTELITPLTGIGKDKVPVKFNPQTDMFEILFDGNPEHQVQIFKSLALNNFGVIGFAVPRSGLLESLYIDLVKDGGVK
jgi:ABC-2 type transport system ATP-binding protein